MQSAGCDPRHALPNAGLAPTLKSHHDVRVSVFPSYSLPLPRLAKMFTVMKFVALITSCFAIAVLAMDASLDDAHKAFYDNNIFGDVMPATNFSCILGLQYTLNGETNLDTFSGIHLIKASQLPIAPLPCSTLTQISSRSC